MVEKGNIFAVPILHYTMESAATVVQAFKQLAPDCVAVELPQSLEKLCIQGASRLPSQSVIIAKGAKESGGEDALYYSCEVCDPAFEGIRSAIEGGVSAFCIDLDVAYYPPGIREQLPDSYAISKIGLAAYYQTYINSPFYRAAVISEQDRLRELFMAHRLKELSLCYDRILLVVGMFHLERILQFIDNDKFPAISPCMRLKTSLVALDEASAREVPAEYGWISSHYERWRSSPMLQPDAALPNRHTLLFRLYKEASFRYIDETGNAFPSYNLRNLMKFSRNCAFLSARLVPDLFRLLCAAKGCVDHNYAYYVWELATENLFMSNIDSLPVESLSIEQVWGASKLLRFHMKERSRKAFERRRSKARESYRFLPPALFGICSHQPEDIVIERFGDFLKKRGQQILSEEASRTVPFSASLEDGVDTKETIRHWYEGKIYVKARGKPPGGVGAIVVIFDDDEQQIERYPWRGSWHGEHAQESDMAFFATPIGAKLIGPGISRCEYGGFLLSYPPRRLGEVWSDPDYESCQTKAELLLMVAIDYSLQPSVVYVAAKAPRTALKTFAARYGKKILYIPIGQLSPVTLNKLRVFHVLDGHHRRAIAGEYIL